VGILDGAAHTLFVFAPADGSKQQNFGFLICTRAMLLAEQSMDAYLSAETRVISWSFGAATGDS
jgi:hypothetical protein